ncbi:MAG: [FeFe] hydrogenase H-cluster radical SAM maturase HydE [Terracidiphilus sp.]|jgi:biotin synthase
MTEMTKVDLLEWLRESHPSRLQELYERADAVRSQHVGDAIHLRGLIEVSSHCVRQCMYCGLRQGNRALTRYRMTRDEILDCAREAERLGYGTVVMQAGEDEQLTAEWIAEIVRWIKRETSLAVTLSLGERQEDELQLWRSAGADRYLLRFETSNQELFRAIHPSRVSGGPDRLTLLRHLKGLGYEAGGGVMVGIPGQSFESLAEDILTFRALNLDMIGIGPYIAHAATPLGSGALRPAIALSEQVPNSEEMVYKMISLTRIVCPDANIPSTTALATINKLDGRKQGLRVGANVVMPNLTPVKYRRLYEIYPAKACIDESATDCNQCLRGQIHSLGRFAGQGQGGRGVTETLPGISPDVSSQFVQLQNQ